MAISPYAIPYASLLPRREHCTNLVVPVCVSASHIAFGSVCTEPALMALGHVAGLAAGLSAIGGRPSTMTSTSKLPGKAPSEGRGGTGADEGRYCLFDPLFCSDKCWFSRLTLAGAAQRVTSSRAGDPSANSQLKARINGVGLTRPWRQSRPKIATRQATETSRRLRCRRGRRTDTAPASCNGSGNDKLGGPCAKSRQDRCDPLDSHREPFLVL